MECIEAVLAQGVAQPLADNVGGLLGQVRENQRLKRIAAARDLELAAHFCDLTGWVAESSSLGLPGVERLVQVGHDGTPEVAEFSSLQLAAAMGCREEYASELMSVALDIKFRLPEFWSLVMVGDFDVWKARELAVLTKELDYRSCREVSAKLAGFAGQLGWPRLREWAKALVVEHTDPDERADEVARRQAGRHVDFRQSWLGVTEMDASLDVADAVVLDGTIDRLADILGRGGRVESKQERRAISLGILASPARALQLLQADLLEQLPDDLAGECPRQGQPGHACGAVTVDPEELLPKAQLVVHLSRESLGEGTGETLARLDTSGKTRVRDLGPVLVEQLADVLGHRRVTVRPVVDCEGLVPIDSYEVPERMRFAVQLRHRFEAFPWSTRRFEGCDLDHTEPFRAGVPGQTRPDNLAPPWS